jgi:hypothetical protein
MKNLILASLICSLAAAAACAGAPVKGGAAKYQKYSMDNNYFSCSIPSAWDLSRDAEEDAKYSIYEIQLEAPNTGKGSASIKVAYYAKESTDFRGFQDFIDSNSKNVFGETKSAREQYEPVKKIKLAGRQAFELSREMMQYLHPESKSDESVQLKEKFYVLPAKEGFYVLSFSAEKTAYLANVKVFEKVAKSFKGKP